MPLTAQFADLHLHSTASDGAHPPSEVVRRAHRAGLTAMALTDHDTLAGTAEARREAEALGLRLLSGCEFSVAVAWGEAHLLGYQLPEDDPAVNRFLVEMRSRRAERGVAMVAAINRCGVALSHQRVEAIAAGAPIGRPHVARALVEAGVTRSIDEGFDRFLGRGRPAFVGKELPTLVEVTDLVKRAGGVSSLAHLKDRGTRANLLSYRAQGVDGVEVAHPSHSGPVREELARLARELGLLPTGGSDAHGEAAVGPSHGEVGAVRIPMDWVVAIEAVAASRRPTERRG